MTPMRRAARAIVEPAGGSLKADRGEALYITDIEIKLPERAQEVGAALERADFSISKRGGLWALTPGQSWYGEMESALSSVPAGLLSRGMERFRGREILPEEQALWMRCVKALELNRPMETLERAVREQAACCLRTGRGGGLLHGCARIIDGRKKG
jgi:hypothetical protein